MSARALSPIPDPAAMPQMMAMMFFIAPQSSTPTKSVAVSYTHLDVYKRQGIIRDRSGANEHGGLFESALDLGMHLRSRLDGNDAHTLRLSLIHI